MRKVIVAIDGSEVSKGVIRYALHYAAREADAELLFLHVIPVSEDSTLFYGEGAVFVPPSNDAVKREFETFIDKELRAMCATPEKMSVTVRSGRVSDEIVQFAIEEDAYMIMIGHRGLSGLERFFLGSVASKVVANAPCSVYVYRPKELREKK
jgi:nucleotide-binding universal stress UspA family protein